MTKSKFSIISCIIICLLLTAALFGCAGGSGNLGRSENSGASQQAAEVSSESEASSVSASSESEYSPAEASDDGESSSAAGILSSAEDIDLRLAGLDEPGYVKTYYFTYDGQKFTAQYMEDNWTICDSYRITDKADMEIICEALLDAHPVHGCDMISTRTPEDMAFEWEQHNIAYESLPEGNEWRESAKDVDFDPADQGKTLIEMYRERTGKELLPEDLLRR